MKKMVQHLKKKSEPFFSSPPDREDFLICFNYSLPLGPYF